MFRTRSGPRVSDRARWRSSPSWRPPAARHDAVAPPPPARPPASQARRRPADAPLAPSRRPRRRRAARPQRRHVVRWFVGLGAGGQPQQLAAETDFVNKFNNVRRRTVYISLEIYDNKVAANILKTQIAAGNAPDIIGPVGVEGLNLFRDQLLDLAAADRLDRLRHEQGRPGARRLLQDRRGRRHDRRPVRDLPVVPLVQQGAVRRGQAAVPADQGRRACTRASRGTWTPSASSA